MHTYNTLSDNQLAKRLQSGDQKAFTEIYNRYWEKLLAISFFHCRDKQAAEDTVHEVMMSLWTRRTDIQIQSLDAYLATAIKFSVFKAIAREKRRKQLLTQIESSTEISDIEARLDARFLEEYLNGTLEKLPEKTRLVFNYSRNADLSVKEIANKIDLSPKSAEYHLTKALKALREALQKIKLLFI